MGEPEGTELPLDVVYGLLSNERRRRTLRYMAGDARREPVTLGDLAEHIAGIENGKPPVELSSAERKRVYICLYQCHLPQMDDAGVLEFDEDRKTIELGENAVDVMAFLPGEAEGGSAEDGVGALTAVGSLLTQLSGRIGHGA